MVTQWNRRQLGWMGLGALASRGLRGQTGAGADRSRTAGVLQAAYAGSMTPLMEGGMKAAMARLYHLDLQGHGQGANLVADSIVNGTLTPDVFLSVTKGPMLTVLQAGKADLAIPVGRTEMVLAYSPKSRLTPRFEAAARGSAAGVPAWWQILEEPGLRFGRSNPAGDPGGRNAIFVMMLAAKQYRQPDLVEKVLGPAINPLQIATGGPSATARLASGDLDAAMSYRIGPAAAGTPFLALPKEINLSSLDVAEQNPETSLMLGGKTFRPEPMVFYAAALKGAANPQGAALFMDFLKTAPAQALFAAAKYDPPGAAAVLSPENA